jgi:hypothetical protein
MSKEAKAAVRKKDAVKLAILEIQTERAAKKAAAAGESGLDIL